MSNTEARPRVNVCSAEPGARIHVIVPRDVPLGGPRAMNVRRTLPARERSLIGAWCFLDHYGPDDTADTGGMRVAPHPHTGLQTVSWLFTGAIEHRDSAGNVAMVLPGEVNLMTGGHGISHSENTLPDGPTLLHGAQLWVALPAAARHTAPDFAHFVPTPVHGRGWQARVFLGSSLGSTSPVSTHTPLLGAEITLEPKATLELPVEATFEHGVLVDTGAVALRVVDEASGPQEEIALEPRQLAYTPPGATTIALGAAAEPTRLLVLGGPPFGEQILMWWNFVGRTHNEIVAFREDWQAQIAPAGALVDDSQDVAPGRFGIVAGNHQRPIPAPPMPNATLRPRG